MFYPHGVATVYPGFRSNVFRLMGMHLLSAADASRLWGISTQAISAWRMGHTEPSAARLFLIARFFEVPAERLAEAEFSDLLAHELASPERFAAVERKIATAGDGAEVVDLRPPGS